MTERYEGWTNSATYLAAFYLRQSAEVYQRIIKMITRAPLNAETMSVVMARVVIRKPDVEDDLIVGVIDNILFLDSWAEGEINWQEIANIYTTELEITPEPVSSELQKMMTGVA